MRLGQSNLEASRRFAMTQRVRNLRKKKGANLLTKMIGVV